MKFFTKCKYWAELAWIVFLKDALFWLSFGIIYMGMGIYSAIKDEGNFLPWRWFIIGLIFYIPTILRLLKENK